jgi:histidine triad (HIT) family protein
MNIEKKCLFCLIVEKKIDANILFENDESLAFSDINPISEGHSLIITKKHYDNLLEIDEEG